MDFEKFAEELKELPKEEIIARLKNLSYEDMDFAKIDHHRQLRKGVPEAIFCEGKTKEQILKIIGSMKKYNHVILATRAGKDVYDYIKKEFPEAVYNEAARMIVIHKEKPKQKGLILVLTAGTADIPVAEEAAVTAEAYGNNVERLFDVGVAGIHRLLSNREQMQKAEVIIVVAGMEGALGSIVSGLVSCPVIAVPTSVGYGASFKGIAPLLTMLNSCSPGIAVVNIDNGFGAGYFANLILK